MDSINTRIAEELSALPSGRVQPQQVAAAVALLDEGSTVPFIARYRKEVTGSLDDTQLRMLEERLRYLRELEERRGAILASIEEQGKLTPELARDIKLADTKTRLEDLYLPYKQKRRTKARSPWKPASARWPTHCSTTRPWSRKARPRVSSTPRKASPTSRRCWKAPSTSSWSASPKTPRCSTSCACS